MQKTYFCASLHDTEGATWSRKSDMLMDALTPGTLNQAVCAAL